jgi:hypothetical protein
MNIIKISQESLNFFLSQFFNLLVLIGPWFVVYASLQEWLVFSLKDADPETLQLSGAHMAAMLSIMVTWVYIQACITLFINERSKSDEVRINQVWFAAWSYVPHLMLATVITISALLLTSLPAILSNFYLLLVLPMWLVLRLSYINFFVVLEHKTPLKAVEASYQFSQSLVAPTTFAFLIMMTIVIIHGWIQHFLPNLPIVGSILLNSFFNFLSTCYLLILFRVYMLAKTQATPEDQTID